MAEFKKKMLLLSKIKANQQNPRIISESKLKKLINSLLIFPKMLNLRPIVVGYDNFVLGGNMRLLALSRIAQMTFEELQAHLETLPGFNDLEEGGHEVLEYWEQFLNKPQTEVVCADSLTNEEKLQFIIKDNVSFGDWDYDELEHWDEAKLDSWGVDTLLPDFGQSGGGTLPPELEGQDLTPDELQKLEGEDNTDKKRIIISYYPEQENQLLSLLGIKEITKITYDFEEILKLCQ